MVNNLQDQYSALQSEHFALISTLEESQRTKMVASTRNFFKKRLVPTLSKSRRLTIKTGKYWSDSPPQFGSSNERHGSNVVRDSITCPESPDSSPYVALADCSSWVDFEDRFPDDGGF